MSDINTPVEHHHLQPIGGHAPKPKRRWPWVVSGVVGAFLLGAVIGSAGGSGSTAAAPTVTTTTTKVETQEMAPDSCLEALDLADKGFTFAYRALSSASDALTAVSSFDVDGIEAAGEDMQQVNSEMSGLADQYNSAKAECRAAG